MAPAEQRPTSKVPYLNVGCGARSHPDWTNIDLGAASPDVVVCDILKGTPFVDGCFEAVYMSHVLEHFARSDAPRVLAECFRLLRPGGIVRIVAPDLEAWARTYLEVMGEALAGAQGADGRYDWMLLELLDHLVKTRSGGEWAEYLYRDPLPNEEWILARLGEQWRESRARRLRTRREAAASGPSVPVDRRSWWTRLKHRLVVMLMGRESLRNMELGEFRRSGEGHQWMYDRYSLGRLLREAGFVDARAAGMTESQIPDWGRYGLDDPHWAEKAALYMEARRPGEQQE